MNNKCLLLLVLLILVLGTIVGATSPIGLFGSLIFSSIVALSVVAVVNNSFGLAIVLFLMPLDRTIHPALQYFTWYPRALHVVDPITVALVIGFAVRVLRRQVHVEWHWYDAVYLAFITILSLSALHGLLEHHRYVLREGRPIPWLLTYFPARELFARLRETGRRIEPLLLSYGIVYSLIAFILAFSVRDTFGRSGDVLLPRLPYVVDMTPLILLVMVGISILIWRKTALRENRLAVAGLVVFGCALAIANTRSYLLGIATASLVLIILVLSQQDRRWPQMARLAAVFAILFVGIALPHIIRVGIVRDNQKAIQKTQDKKTSSSSFPPSADPLFEAEVEVPKAPELSPMPATKVIRIEKLKQGQDENMINRMREIQVAWKDVKRHPILGVGIGLPFEFTLLRWDGQTRQIQQSFMHSGYFAVLRSAGIPGLLSLLLVVGSFLTLALKARKGHNDLILLTGALVLIAFIPIIQFANVVFMPGAVWFGALLGSIGSLATSQESLGQSLSETSGEAGK